MPLAVVVAGLAVIALSGGGHEPPLGTDHRHPGYDLYLRAVAEANTIVVDVAVYSLERQEFAVLTSQSLSGFDDGFSVSVEGATLHFARMDMVRQLERAEELYGQLVMLEEDAETRGETIAVGERFHRRWVLEDGYPVAGGVHKAFEAARLASTVEAVRGRTVRYLRVTIELVPLGNGLWLAPPEQPDPSEQAEGGPVGTFFHDAGVGMGCRPKVLLSRIVTLPRPLRVRDWGLARDAPGR